MAGVHLSSFEVFLLYRYVSYIGRDRSHDGFGQVPAVAVEFISENFKCYNPPLGKR